MGSVARLGARDLGTRLSGMSILDRIAAAKREEVERLKAEIPVAQLEERIERQARPQNFAGALMGASVRVIAEIKRASPTRGVLRADFDSASLAKAYAEGGAAAVSVLTNAEHFQGSIQHLESAQIALRGSGVPVLRKEFIFDPYQVYEARAYGADAMLLIVAMLTPESLAELFVLSQRFWMQCLVEVHDERELAIALDAGAEIIGINNRDLRTFVTDLATTERVAPQVPPGKIVVSESGIADRADVRRVGAAGAHAVLIGESLVTAPDVAAKLGEFV